MHFNVPTMTQNIVLNTTIHEPAMTAGEVDMLLFALERSRAQFAWKCAGLDAAELSKPHPPSAMTIGGLLKHLALDEDRFTAVDLTGEPLGPPWDTADFKADPEWDWRSAAADSPEELYALWQGAVESSRAAWARVLADGGLDQPSKFVMRNGESPNLRRILVDLHDEYARHVGHADLFREDLDPSVDTPGRLVVRHIGESVVAAMEVALGSGTPAAAQLVAGECVVFAETKDHLNWELFGAVAEKATGTTKTALKDACSQVEEQEDEHLYHSTGWTRELWIDSLGMPAVLPPPEERKDVKTAIGAARAKNARDEMT